MPYLFFLLLLSAGYAAQTLGINLLQASCQLFKGHLFCYGITGGNSKSALKVYKLNAGLKIVDSMVIEKPHYKASDFLRLYSDTLHGQLNIYLPKKEKKAVDVYHLDGAPAMLSTAEDVEIARLNNTSLFSPETFFFHNTVYSIKTSHDTSGLQFYLNKYELNKNASNFDYGFVWQYPFERKNVHSAHILFADSRYIYLYVTVRNGSKAGQWLLKINGAGKLVKGTKLNASAEQGYYGLPVVYADKNSRSLWLAGQKFSYSQIDLNAAKLSMEKDPLARIYLIEIDSLDEPVQRHEFKFPIAETKNGTKKVNAAFLLRFNKLSKKADDGFTLETDIYRNNGEPMCYFYTSSSVIGISKNEEKFIATKTIISANAEVERFYMNNDKLDMNGRICIDSLSKFETLFYTEPVLPVKDAFKTDDAGNPYWLLRKSLIKKNSIQFATLTPVKKVYSLKVSQEIDKNHHPQLIVISSQFYITASDDSDGKLMLNLHSW